MGLRRHVFTCRPAGRRLFLTTTKLNTRFNLTLLLVHCPHRNFERESLLKKMACHQAQTKKRKDTNVSHVGLNFSHRSLRRVPADTRRKREDENLNSVDAPNVTNDNRIITREEPSDLHNTLYFTQRILIYSANERVTQSVSC